MTKSKNLLVIIISALLFIGIGVTAFIAFAPFQNDKPIQSIKQQIIDGKQEFADGFVFNKNDKFVRFNNLNAQGSKYKIVQSLNTPFTPMYSIIRCNCFDNENFDGGKVYHIYLERKNLFDWNIKEIKFTAFANTDFNTITNLASQYDLTTDFPGKGDYTIQNYPPLTREEIESYREMRKEEEANTKVISDFKAETNEGLLALCLDDEQELKNIIEAAKRGDKTFQTKRRLVQVDVNKIPIYEKDLAGQQIFCQDIRDGKIKR
jgi:hypothetical protein